MITNGQVALRNRYYKATRQPKYQWKHKGWKEKVKESMENNHPFLGENLKVANRSVHNNNKSYFADKLKGFAF